MGFGCLALLLPQARQARRGTQLEQFRTLLARNVERLVKTRLGFFLKTLDSRRGAS